jgi:hypothetical protein
MEEEWDWGMGKADGYPAVSFLEGRSSRRRKWEDDRFTRESRSFNGLSYSSRRAVLLFVFVGSGNWELLHVAFILKFPFPSIIMPPFA